MNNFPCDRIVSEKMFLLYTKTFIPKVYESINERSPLYEWANINGNDFISAVYIYTNTESRVNEHGYYRSLDNVMNYIITNRHLDDFWVQSYLLKKL